jgi:hypothetical protein
MREIVRPAAATSDAPAVSPPDVPAIVPGDNPDAAPRTTADNSQAQLGTLRSGARQAIDFWKTLMVALSWGYQAGFLWVSAVGVYLLLRRDIDGVQTSEVFVDQDEEYGMPPLTPDAATGVPSVSPGDAALAGDVANPADLPRSD